MIRPRSSPASTFPLSAGLLLGIGFGGFIDGIVLHQLLQWHHMLTAAGYPANTVAGLELNTLADGLFHAVTYACALAGVAMLWRAAHTAPAPWSVGSTAGSVLMGFGGFNLVEGIVNHHILGLHHVNETVDPRHWLWWDLGFLAAGAAMMTGGWVLRRRARRHERS